MGVNGGGSGVSLTRCLDHLPPAATARGRLRRLRCPSNGGAKARARTPPPGPTRLLPPRPGGLVGGTGRRRRRPPPLSEKKSRGKGNTCGVGSAGAQLRSSSSWVMSERCSNELMEVDRHPPLVCIVYARGVPHLEQSCAPQAALQRVVCLCRSAATDADTEMDTARRRMGTVRQNGSRVEGG